MTRGESRTAGLRARRSYFVAAATAAVVLSLGNPLARAVGLGHWSSIEDERKLAILERSDLAPDVLLLGSSRVKFALVAHEIERRLAAALEEPVVAYNAALASTGVLEASWILDEVIARDGCPRAVVADVNVEGLNAASARLEQGLRLYLPPRRWPGVLAALRRPARLEAALAGLATGYGHLLYALQRPPGSAAARREAELVLACRGSVYGPAGRSCRAGRERTLADAPPIRLRRQLRWYRIRLRQLHRLPEFRLGGLPEEGLDRLVEACRRCESDLLLLTLPTLYPWEEWGYGEAVAAATALAREVGRREGVRYVDLSRRGVERGLESFYDPGHLSRRGALRVSARVAGMVARSLRSPGG